MIYVALTGIARHVMKELLAPGSGLWRSGVQQLCGSAQLQARGQIFLTESSAPDILLGTNGLIASVMGIQMILIG